MLKSLRKKGFAKKVLWVVAIIIIISFGFFGTAYLLTGSGRVGYAGKIFGKKVSFDDFNKVFQSTRIQAIRQYGNNLDRVAPFLDLENQTWDRLILLHEANRRRLRVSNDEVIKAIAQDKSFERDGRFDILLYNAILRNLRVRPRDYEESVRDNLRITDLYRQVTSSVTVAEEDVFGEYKKRNEKAQVSYVFVAPETFKADITADEEETKQYYEQNKAEFLRPAAVNVQYLTFDFPEEPEEGETDPADQEDDAADPEEPAVPIEEQKDLAREKAHSVFQELLIDPDMAKAAQQNGLEIKTSGFFSIEQPYLTLGWSYEFLNDIFEMDAGEISEPFETQNGLSIVQIKEKRESYIPDFSEARPEAAEAVLEKKAREIAGQKAAEYSNAIINELDKSKVRDFSKAAKELNLEIHQTPVFNRGQYLPQIGLSREFQEAAFQLTEENKVSQVVETTTGYCILHLDDYIPVDKVEYEDNKEALARELSDEKRNTVFGDFVAQLRIEANLTSNLAPPEEETR